MNRAALEARAARALERGEWRSPVTLALSSVWAEYAEVVRHVPLPRGVRVVGVGGATLGGSWKTPLVLGLARALASQGQRVAVVAHAYRATVRRAARVAPSARVTEVGDEALWLARELQASGVPVIVGPDREASILLAASLAPLVVVDALLQTRPVPLALSVLAVDAAAPWGAGACPPAGDLRAPVETLLAAADLVARVGEQGSGVAAWPPRPGDLTVASRCSSAADAEGRTVPLASLGTLRVGLVLAIARPDRILRTLAAEGVAPTVVCLGPDHGTPEHSGRKGAVDLWLTSTKCATKLGPAFGGSPVLVLRHEIVIPDALVRAAVDRQPPPP